MSLLATGGGNPLHYTRPDRCPPHKAVQLSDWLLSPKFHTVQKPDSEPSGLELANPESQPHFQPVGGDGCDWLIRSDTNEQQGEVWS